METFFFNTLYKKALVLDASTTLVMNMVFGTGIKSCLSRWSLKVTITEPIFIDFYVSCVHGIKHKKGAITFSLSAFSLSTPHHHPPQVFLAFSTTSLCVRRRQSIKKAPSSLTYCVASALLGMIILSNFYRLFDTVHCHILGQCLIDKVVSDGIATIGAYLCQINGGQILPTVC